jgi:hypothetical protein
MPNWCENKLILQGSESSILAFEARYFVEVEVEVEFDNPNQQLDNEGNCIKAKCLEFRFEKVKPLPPEHQENWYDWCIENWGTKWDVCHFVRGDKPGTYFFDTAWSFPQALFDELASQLENDFAGLYFEGYFFEAGFGYSGNFYYNDQDGFECHSDEDRDSLREIAKEHFNYDPYDDEAEEDESEDESEMEDDAEFDERDQAQSQWHLNMLASEVSVLLKCIKFY